MIHTNLRSRTRIYIHHLSAALVFGLLLSSTLFGAVTHSEWKSNNEARTRLLTPFGLEADGRSLWIGLEVELEPGWHSYWKNPGAAGLPPAFTIIDESLVSDVEIQFPPPKFYPFGGGLDANGYADHVIYPVRLTLTEEAAGQSEPQLDLDLFYLVCKNLCIPHEEEFRLTVSLTKPSSVSAAERGNSNGVAGKLHEAMARLPLSPADLPGYSARESLTRDGDDYLLSIQVMLSRPGNEFPEIFFHTTPTLKLGQPQFYVGGSTSEIVIRIPVQAKVAGQEISEADFGYVLTHMNGEEGFISVEKEVHLALSDDDPVGAASISVSPTVSLSEQPAGSALSLLEVILLALIGGLILNIMPCVLPVLSIKLMGVIQHSGESRGKIARGMLASSAGIVVSFLSLATAAVIARSVGASVGWGIQFQEPMFVTFLALIVFLFGLNLWGVFEVTLPSLVTSGAAQASGRGHFVQGMFATLLATPCSAPFLGSAVSFALSSPPWVVYSIFTALGIGMSLPYLVIAVAPGAIRYMPKPGPWMEKAKIFFGFLLMATVIWLMYVLSLQADSLTLSLVWLGMLLVGLIVWMKKAAAPMARFFGSAGGVVSVIGILAVSGYTIYLAGQSGPRGATALNNSGSGINWAVYSEEKVREHLAEGEVVFVDVTAEWCVTCKFNEKLFIETDQIIDRINQNGIVALKADWTNRNREIGDFLARYGRSGIPFYIVYYGGDEKNYIALPITITGSKLAKTLDEAIEKNRIFTRAQQEKPAALMTTP